MKTKKKGEKQAIIIKPVLWRQSGFTLFLFVVAGFFSMVGYIGIFFSWLGTIVFFLLGILNLLDQIFEWSRLKINQNGYSYRGWWRKQHYKHEEIESFSSEIYAGRPLIMINLRKKAFKKRGLEEKPIAFPCSFGRPVEDTLKTLRKNLDKTPRALI
ncbi:hypothetical protein OAV71_03715 [Opitutales bacterium]|nr:hypothetical protein [Opitutales bacterium]